LLPCFGLILVCAKEKLSHTSAISFSSTLTSLSTVSFSSMSPGCPALELAVSSPDNSHYCCISGLRIPPSIQSQSKTPGMQALCCTPHNRYAKLGESLSGEGDSICSNLFPDVDKLSDTPWDLKSAANLGAVSESMGSSNNIITIWSRPGFIQLCLEAAHGAWGIDSLYSGHRHS